MPLKTILDCVQCPHLARCDTHISNGTYKHLEGSNPCELIINKDRPGQVTDRLSSRLAESSPLSPFIRNTVNVRITPSGPGFGAITTVRFRAENKPAAPDNFIIRC